MGRYNYRNRWKNPHKAGEQMYAEKKKGRNTATRTEKGVKQGKKGRLVRE